MNVLSLIEKKTLENLFNRNGYVLDFSTPRFDEFTFDSVGVALCHKYQLSKGASLSMYLSEADDFEIAKLLTDLFMYYELNFYDEISKGGKYAQLYRQCKPIIARVTTKQSVETGVDVLKNKFSNKHIDSQIDIMLDMQDKDPTEAIGKAKELLESCCRTILEKSGIPINKDWKMTALVDNTLDILQITPKHISDSVAEAESIKAILGNLKVLVQRIAELRNSYGSGHGKSSSYKGLEARHARLAVGCSITITRFLWDSYDRMCLKKI